MKEDDLNEALSRIWSFGGGRRRTLRQVVLVLGRGRSVDLAEALDAARTADVAVSDSSRRGPLPSRVTHLLTLSRTLLTSSSLPVTSAATCGAEGERFRPISYQPTGSRRRLPSCAQTSSKPSTGTYVASDRLGGSDGAEGGRVDEPTLVLDPDEARGAPPARPDGGGSEQARGRSGGGSTGGEHGSRRD